MRLSNEQITVIKTTITEIFGKNSTVYLFGSRIDDNSYGGDIDLLIQTPYSSTQVLEKKLKTHARLCKLLGERKIDLITTSPEKKDSRSIVHNAISKGTKL